MQSIGYTSSEAKALAYAATQLLLLIGAFWLLAYLRSAKVLAPAKILAPVLFQADIVTYRYLSACDSRVKEMLRPRLSLKARALIADFEKTGRVPAEDEALWDSEQVRCGRGLF